MQNYSHFSLFKSMGLDWSNSAELPLQCSSPGTYALTQTINSRQNNKAKWHCYLCEIASLYDRLVLWNTFFQSCFPGLQQSYKLLSFMCCILLETLSIFVPNNYEGESKIRRGSLCLPVV